MYKDILLLMDCSSVDETVVRHVAELAEIHGSTVHMFHVVHAHTLDQRAALQGRADACLKRALTELQRRGVPADVSTAEGEPVEQVLALLDRGSYDLIALATHGHGPVSDAILGSVSRSLKHRTDIPVLMIRGER